jgi:hypothetical protein
MDTRRGRGHRGPSASQESVRIKPSSDRRTNIRPGPDRFASSAVAATDGVIRDAVTGAIIPENRELHGVGWASFEAGSIGKMTCDITSVIKMIGPTGTTGNVTNFSVPDVTKCTWTSFIAGCHLTSNTTRNLPYHVTVTPPAVGNTGGDFAVTPGAAGIIILTQNISGNLCPIADTDASVTVNSPTLKPLKTGSRVVTNTLNKLGETSGREEPIAGIEFESTGVLDAAGSETPITIKGELELTEIDRCTWKIAAS